jgi:NAD(P)-dependent dehydrogenase (short-subunit alcohol dehydrogenase family)
LTIGLAKEVAAEGIRVNAVRAGYIRTDMHASGGEPERIERVKAFVPLKRGGVPEEVAYAIPVASLQRIRLHDRQLHRRRRRQLAAD